MAGSALDVADLDACRRILRGPPEDRAEAFDAFVRDLVASQRLRAEAEHRAASW